MMKRQMLQTAAYMALQGEGGGWGDDGAPDCDDVQNPG